MQDILIKALEEQDTLCHHGILGQKWGVRRYQNSDGSLTDEGKKRYYSSSRSDKLNDDGSLNERGKRAIEKVYNGKFGPANIMKADILRSTADAINTDPTNRQYSRAMKNRTIARERMQEELYNKYGVDYEDYTDEDINKLTADDKHDVHIKLQQIDSLLSNDFRDAYASRLLGENTNPSDLYKVSKVLGILDNEGYLDPDRHLFDYTAPLLNTDARKFYMSQLREQELDETKSFVDRLLSAVGYLNLSAGSSGWVYKR